MQDEAAARGPTAAAGPMTSCRKDARRDTYSSVEVLAVIQ